MAGAVDFSKWVAPDLELPLGDKTYTVLPPSVDRAKKIIALAVKAEVEFGIVKGPIPDGVEDVLATIGPDERPGLGRIADQMVADEVDVYTLSRMHTYAVFYWARGPAYADALAVTFWTPRAPESDDDRGEDAVPKALTRLLLRSGRISA